MKPSFSIYIYVALVFTLGCGTIAGNPKKPDGGGTTPPSQYTTDTTATTNLLSAHVDDALDAVGEDKSASTTTLAMNLRESALLQDEYTVTCSLSDQTATSTRNFSGTRTDTFGRFNRSFTRTRVGSDLTIVKWISANSQLSCSTGSPALPKIDFTQTTNLNQKSTIDRSWKVTLVNNTSGVTVQERESKIKGSRNFVWDASSATNGTSSVQRSGTWSMTREDKLTNKAGTSFAATSTVKVDDSNPMITVTTWNTSNPGTWKTRTIQSGTIQHDHDDSSRISLSFSNLQFTKLWGCTPTEGTITGKVFNTKDDTEPALTFTMTFASGQGSIAWSNGEITTYTPSSCSLDE